MEQQQRSNNNNALSITGKLLPVADKNAATKKKRRGAMHMIKVALFMLRRRSGKSKSAEAVASNGGVLNRLVGSMRPLHLQSNGSPRHITNNSNSIDDHPKQQNSDVVNITSTQQMHPTSPAGSSSSSPSSSSGEDGMSRYASVGNLTELESRYASAVNLRELDEDDEESEHEYDENGGDEMIDVKAEEFIAQFYAQMRLQRLNSVDRRYNEMIERSIS